MSRRIEYSFDDVPHDDNAGGANRMESEEGAAGNPANDSPDRKKSPDGQGVDGLPGERLKDNPTVEALVEDNDNEIAEQYRREQRENRSHCDAAEQWKRDLHGLLTSGSVFRFALHVFLFFVFSYIAINLISLFRLVNESTGAIRCAVVTLIAFLLGAFVYCLVEAYRLFRKLPRIPQVKPGTKDETEQSALREYASKLPRAEAFYPYGEALKDCVEKINRKSKDEVCEYSVLESLVKDLQEAQNSAAKKVVNDCARLTGLKTAACPWRAGDVIIVVINTALMTCAIARIYHRNISKRQAYRFAFKWLMQLYLAGQMQDIAEGMTSGVAQSMDGDLLEGSTGWSEYLSSAMPICAKFVGKVAEGAAVYYLVRRLGKCAIREFSVFHE